MDSDKIYKNKFVKKVINNSTEIIKRDPVTANDIKRFRQGKAARKRKKTQYIQYNSDVFNRLMRVLETLDDLRAVQIFLRQFPYAKTLKKNKITRTVYAIYHIEVYFMKVASLRDKLALLINDVYDLGLPDKKVNIELISEIKHLKGSRVISLLKKFYKALYGIVGHQNLVAHRGKYDDKQLSEIKMYEIVEDKIKPAAFYVKLMTRHYVQEKLGIFKKNQAAIEEFLDKLFLSLKDEFDRKCRVVSDTHASI